MEACDIPNNCYLNSLRGDLTRFVQFVNNSGTWGDLLG
jgi:hypothetical protein